MAKKGPRKPSHRPGAPPRSGIAARRRDDGAWELTHPRCARERAEDLEEVRTMIEHGEVEVAVDELRFLLSECSDFLEAHVLCGELAAAGEKPNLELARGHFGYAYVLGEQALRAARCDGRLPGALAANAAWHDAALGLAWCLERLGQSAMADEVCATACRLDPTDPAGVRAALDDLRSGGLPIVTLG